MSRYCSDNNRTALITLSAFALLAISLTFGLALLQSDVQAVGVNRQNASRTHSQDRNARSQKSGGVKTSGTGAISGTVTDAVTFAPLQGVRVWIVTPDGVFCSMS